MLYTGKELQALTENAAVHDDTGISRRHPHHQFQKHLKTQKNRFTPTGVNFHTCMQPDSSLLKGCHEV